MAEFMKSTNDILFWDASFFRGVHAQELEAMLGFMNTIYGSSIRGFGEDKMCWKPGRDKGFKVNDYYRILVGSIDYCLPWKSIWKQKIPSQVAFFVSTAALGKCLKIDNLRKRKVWIWIGATCASVMVNQLIIVFFIIRLQWICGLWCLVCLE